MIVGKADEFQRPFIIVLLHTLKHRDTVSSASSFITPPKLTIAGDKKTTATVDN